MEKLYFKTSEYSEDIYTSYLNQNINNKRRYHIYSSFKYNQSPNINKLKKTLQYVVNNNYNLRSTFKYDNNNIFHQTININIDIEKYINIYYVESYEEYKSVHYNAINSKFDMDNGLLFHFNFIHFNNSPCFIFLAKFHHIIIDGNNFDRLMEEISNIYNAEKIDITKTDIDQINLLKEYIKYEEVKIKSSKIDKIIAPAIGYNANMKFTSNSSFMNNAITETIYNINNEELFSQIKIITKEFDCSFFDFMRIAWATIISIYSNSEKILIAYPINTRNGRFKEVKGAIINTQLFAFNRYKSTTLILENILKNKHEIYQNYSKISDVIKKLAIESITCAISQSDLFINGPVLDSIPSAIENCFELGFSQICLYFNTKNDKLNYAITANEQIFDKETLLEINHHFIAIIKEIIKNPNSNLNAIEYISEKEKLNIISGINNNINQYQPINQSCLSTIFHIVASNGKDKIAIQEEGGSSFTYQEIDNISNEYACKIYNYSNNIIRNIEQGEIPTIAVILDSNKDFIISILSIIKLGYAYVPINRNDPINRIIHIIENSKAKLIITDINTAIKIRNIVNKTVIIETNEINYINIKNIHSQRIIKRYTKNEIASVIYTSGTTGIPKGVKIKHQSIISLVQDCNYIKINSADKFIFLSNIAFDAVNFEVFGTLINGATIFIPNNRLKVIAEPSMFKRYINDNNISIVLLTTSIFHALVKRDITTFTNLEYLIIGGEKLDLEPVRKLYNYANKPKNIINAYGPTENTTISTTYNVNDEINSLCYVPIGHPITNRFCYILDKNMNIQPKGAIGILFVSGIGLSPGYISSNTQTTQCFQNNKFRININQTTKYIYNTGDLVRFHTSNNIEYLGRLDSQIKLRGFRIDTENIRHCIIQYKNIDNAIIKLIKEKNSQFLIAYYTSSHSIKHNHLRNYLKSILPEYMLPKYFIKIKNIPLTVNGKIDYDNLPKFNDCIDTEKDKKEYKDLYNIKRIIRKIWSKYTTYDDQYNDEISFFDAGGNSVGIISVREEIQKIFKVKIELILFFEKTTIESMSNYIYEIINKEDNKSISYNQSKKYKNTTINDIAIIGISLKLPNDINNIESFWDMLINKKSTIRNTTKSDINKECENAKEHNFSVNRCSKLDDHYHFDYEFFNYSKKESTMIDPQQRQFLQCVYHALEDSAIVPSKFNGDIGVFATQGKNNYCNNVNFSKLKDIEKYSYNIANEKDFIATRVSYKLNLTGPSITIQTACSSSLVAINIACESLLNNNCDIAISGGVSLNEKLGYNYSEDMIESNDGHCRPFDEKSSGTVITSGVAAVVLRKLSDAIENNDKIYAVIKSSAINNDGSNKIGFTAPSIKGQTNVIKKAFLKSGIKAEQIGYIETHGTGTKLGDPIEIKALQQAYCDINSSNKSINIPIGAIKSNIGHTDSAAGVFGLIKVALMLDRKHIIPNSNFESINKKIQQFNKIFFIPQSNYYWQSNHKRFASISSFGIGGTNVHTILSEYEVETNNKNNNIENYQIENQYTLLPFSAKNILSAKKICKDYKHLFKKIKYTDLDDVLYTLNRGRAVFNTRGFFILQRQRNQITIAYEYIFNQIKEDKKVVIILDKKNIDNIYCTKQILKRIYDEMEIKKLYIIIIGDVSSLTKEEFKQIIVYRNLKYSFNTIKNSNIDYKDQNIYINISSQKKIDNSHKNVYSFSSFNKDKLDFIILKIKGILWSNMLNIDYKSLFKTSGNRKVVSIPNYRFIKKYCNITQNFIQIENNQNNNINNEAYCIKELKNIWIKHLGIKEQDITNESNFFAMGGESLSLLQTIDDIKIKFGINVSLEELINNLEFKSFIKLINKNKNSNYSNKMIYELQNQ